MKLTSWVSQLLVLLILTATQTALTTLSQVTTMLWRAIQIYVNSAADACLEGTEAAGGAKGEFVEVEEDQAAAE